MQMPTSGGFIPIVPAGSWSVIFFHSSHVYVKFEFSSSRLSKSKSPSRYVTLPSPAHMHCNGLLHPHSWCTKILEAIKDMLKLSQCTKINLTFYVSMNNFFTFQVTQSFKNMSEQHSVVTKYKLLLIWIYCHVIQHTGQMLFLCELFTKIHYRYTLIITVSHIMELYLLLFLNGITDRKHLFSLLDSSYGPWTSQHKNINTLFPTERPCVEINYGNTLVSVHKILLYILTNNILQHLDYMIML